MQTLKKSERNNNTEPVSESPAWIQFEFWSHRLGFLLLILIILSGLGGVFSGGYLSERTRHSPDGTLEITYERFNRLMNDTRLTLYLHPDGNDRLSIALGGDFMRTFRIDNLQPQPDRMYSEKDTLVIQYKRIKTDAPFHLWFTLIPLTPGAVQNTIRINHQPGVAFRQFIYP